MSEFLLLMLGSLLINAALVYAWWAKIRVMIFRNQMFQIRDELWRAAVETNCCEDEGYQVARAHINAHIHLTNLLSLSVVNHFRDAGVESEGERATPCDQIASAVEKAYEDSTHLILNYIILWRASGWFYILRHFVTHFSVRAMRDFYRVMTHWLRSTQPEHVSAEFERQREQNAGGTWNSQRRSGMWTAAR